LFAKEIYKVIILKLVHFELNGLMYKNFKKCVLMTSNISAILCGKLIQKSNNCRQLNLFYE